MVVLLGNVLVKYSATDLITATNLGRETMEKTLFHHLWSNDTEQRSQNNILWRIERKVDDFEGLLEITVNVYRVRDEKLLVSLYTEKFTGDKKEALAGL
jgi:hypothetical protein